ncbi:transcriptional regulator, LysR family [Collimonas sp. OK607]|uniref:LysR family transcriptional regulator n=1 Tax=Collimonas sp. OK607 TaxID=1798194 RepID=UPI0008F03FBD|nr:LysR family transcriptional regulator [Collimonas sp. OK607]SFB21348.1 transcriptional regulator, LysR family [Collimonas sp. OK607]
MDRFLEMQTFNAVVDAGSFVKAADALDMSKAAVSRYVVDMEARLGVRLLHRTTRRLSLTDEGQVFYARSKELLAELQEAEDEITSRRDAASGLLRINAPFTFGILHLAPLWGAFKAQHPKVTLDVTLADRLVDLVEGYDVAIRIATLESSTLVSKRLATTRMVLCASPAYLEQHGVPTHPADLVQHSVISYSYWSTKDEWRFNGPEGPVSVKTNPGIHTNNGDTCRAVALSHQGVILQPTFLVGKDLSDGTLVELMPEYQSIELGIYAVYPTRKHVSPKVRALIEFLTARFAEHGASWHCHDGT